MQNYKITIQYDGTKYNGWQRQKNGASTIQGKIEEVLFKLEGSEVLLTSSGRTDTGVHALEQVANFKISRRENSEEIRSYLNKYLPKDINITSIKEVAPRFHSRLNCANKTYLYRIFTGEKANVFERKYIYCINTSLNLEKMKEASKYFLGSKDFLAFSSLKKVKKSTVRTIYFIDIFEENQEIKIFINANGFLHNMVRIIVGTLVDVGLCKIEPNEIKNIIDSKNRQLASKTMPPHGLFLYNVKY